MARQRLASDLAGVSTRLGQLMAWALHARGRLSDISPYARVIRTRGARAVLRRGHEDLRHAVDTLKWAEERLPKLHSGRPAELGSLHTAVTTAEAQIRQVDQRVLPVLASRTRSDPKYDNFIERFLTDLGFGRDSLRITGRIPALFPVTSHLQHGVPALRVDTRFDQPIFFFSPSIRSFDALSLLYHEIGHVFLRYVLPRPSVMALACLMAPFDPGWPNYAGTTGKGPGSVTLSVLRSNFSTIWHLHEEILADAFAGLTGGHSFTSSLCNVFLFKSGIHELTGNKHPPAAWRVWLSRQACQKATSRPEDDTGQPFDAWKRIAGLPKHQSAQGHLLMTGGQKPVVDGILGRLSRLLVGYGIPLANSTGRPPSYPPELPWKSASVPAILLAASKYRAEGDWAEYSNWERTIAPRVGLPWSLPLSRRAARAIKRYFAARP